MTKSELCPIIGISKQARSIQNESNSTLFRIGKYRIPLSAEGLVSRASSVDPRCATVREMKEGPFEIGNQVLISSHRELLSSKAMVVNVAEKSEQDFGRHD